MHAFFSFYNVQSYQFVQLRPDYSLNEMTNFFLFLAFESVEAVWLYKVQSENMMVIVPYSQLFTDALKLPSAGQTGLFL